jgi:ribosomal 30S subunit maturation factor RimM
MMLEESAYLQDKIGQLLGEVTEMITTGNSVIYKISDIVIKNFLEND